MCVHVSELAASSSLCPGSQSHYTFGSSERSSRPANVSAQPRAGFARFALCRRAFRLVGCSALLAGFCPSSLS
jgi:ribosomal protein S14